MSNPDANAPYTPRQEMRYDITRADGKNLTKADIMDLEDNLTDLLIEWMEQRGYCMNGSTRPVTLQPTSPEQLAEVDAQEAAETEDFGEERECVVYLSDWVRMDAEVAVMARSKAQAIKKAVVMADGDEGVDWKNSWESQGETEVNHVEVL